MGTVLWQNYCLRNSRNGIQPIPQGLQALGEIYPAFSFEYSGDLAGQDFPTKRSV